MPALELLVVDPHDGHEVECVERGSERDHSLCARRDVLLQVSPGTALRGRLDDRVHAEISPGRLLHVLLRNHRDLLPGHVEVSLLDRHLVGELPQHRVELQQVLQSLVVRDLRDRRDPDVLSLVENPEDVPSDPPQAHQPHSCSQPDLLAPSFYTIASGLHPTGRNAPFGAILGSPTRQSRYGDGASDLSFGARCDEGGSDLPVILRSPTRQSLRRCGRGARGAQVLYPWTAGLAVLPRKDRKSTRLNSSHGSISYAVFCLKKKKK